MTGTLGLFSLVDLFQLLATAARTGRLGIQHPTGLARVYFDKGQVVHAEFTTLEGEEAVLALFEDERGTFEFVNGLPAPRRTITTPTESLVLDALRRLDEERRDEAEVGPEVPREAVPYTPEEADARVTLGSDERRVVAAVTGQASIARIATDIAMPEDHVRRVVGRLVSVGVLALRARRPRTAQLVVRLGGGVPSGSLGVDEGILANWASVVGADVREVAVRRPDGSAFAMPVSAVRGGGPYLHVSRATLLRAGLAADETVLVRPRTT